ncbi:MAG: MFS transporter [Gemmatimonadetes bacterium]|nr:MFS transporter [Gemmatimonadota bacterium]
MTEGVHRRRLFVGCIVSLVATAFGFAVRAAILEPWRVEFNLSQEQIGYILGAGLFPFAISIILFSLIVDRIGNGVSMAIAFGLHVVSAIITVAAPLALAPAGSSPEAIAAGQQLGYRLLYIGTFIFALGNGTVEAVVNPVTATLYAREKTRYLNILHAGWPGGLVLGGLVAIAVSFVEPGMLPGRIWQWQVGLVLVPTLLYGFLLAGQRFPVQERVAANVPYVEMLREFGAASCYIVSFLLIAGINQIIVMLGVPALGLGTQLALAVVPTALFAFVVRSFGRPMFVVLLLIMFLLATTELGTDSWIADIMRTVLESPTQGTLFLVWTSLIMFVLRFFAGPIVERITPLGLLAASAAIAALGLVWLSSAGTAVWMLLAAATFYGLGKTFLWPTTLGVVSEQYPRGGALMLNAIAGVGMISVGTLGNPAIGALQDGAFTAEIRAADAALAEQVIGRKPGLFGESLSLDAAERTALLDRLAAEEARVRSSLASATGAPPDAAALERALAADPVYGELGRQASLIATIDARTKQGTLAKIAVLPLIMLLSYIALILYFRSTGGYRARSITDGGVVAGSVAA